MILQTNTFIKILLGICAVIALHSAFAAFHPEEYLSYAINIDKTPDLHGDENAVLFDPVVLESRCSATTNKRKRVIDVTMINMELSTLELRLNELWNVVDVFYIMETTVRFRPSSPPKPLYLTDNWPRFQKFHSKIILEVLPPEASQGANNNTFFGIEAWQRRVHWNLLKDKIKLNVDDLIIYSDMDELPRPDEIEKLACKVNLPRTPICLETKDSFYYYNFLCHIKNEWVNRPRIVHYADGFPNEQRCATKIKNGSTHCSSCFPAIEEYEAKANSNSDPERMVTNRESILKTVRGCKDFWLRKNLDKTMELRETIDFQNIPLTVSKHPDKWPHYLGKGPLYEDIDHK